MNEQAIDIQEEQSPAADYRRGCDDWQPTEPFWSLIRALQPTEDEWEMAKRITHRCTGQFKSDSDVRSEIETNMIFRRQMEKDTMRGIPVMYSGGFKSLCDLGENYAEDGGKELKRAADTLRNWCSEFAAGHARHGWFISGPVGNGKTGLARAVQVHLAKNASGWGISFWTFRELADTFRASYRSDERTYEMLMDEVCKARLLILDDIGATHMSQDQITITFELVNRRQADRAPIIVTSNFDLETLIEKARSGTGQRILDRLRDVCVEMKLRGGSMRGKGVGE
jgi:DNA replication protein DnaC